MIWNSSLDISPSELASVVLNLLSRGRDRVPEGSGWAATIDDPRRKIAVIAVKYLFNRVEFFTDNPCFNLFKR